jgi:DNA gyrase subunit A
MPDEEIPTPDLVPDDLTPGTPADAPLAPTQTIGREVFSVSIEDEMRQSYLDYAMSTIIARALPDVRDGLKPVHRRILMAMSDLNLTPAGQHRKSAKIVGECFVAGTLVSTPNGLVPIQDLSIGDEVYTQSGVRPVTEAYVMPPQALREVEFDNGAVLRCTPGQQFKVWTPDLTSVWKTADALQPGEYIISRSASSVTKEIVKTNGIDVDEDIAYVLGFFLADGWIDRDREHGYDRLSFACKNIEIIEKLQGIFCRKFDVSVAIGEKDGLYTLRVHSTSVNRQIIQAFGLADKLAGNIFVPAAIRQSPASVIFSFLAGFIDGDGSIHTDRNVCVLTSISETFLRDIQTTLQSLGVHSKLYQHKATTSVFAGTVARNCQPCFALEVRSKSYEKLVAGLPLCHAGKSARIAQHQTEMKTIAEKAQLIPYLGQAIFAEFQQRHLGGGWYATTSGKKVRSGLKYANGTKVRYSAGLAENFQVYFSGLLDLGILAKLKALESTHVALVNDLTQNDVSFAQVKAVHPLAKDVTYDIQVDVDHEFIANGVLVHNCMGNYHPHGDAALYATMVRMAQDFNMRYLLVDGQGNFGCFTGDTKIKLLDGTEKSFTELAELPEKEVFPVYSVNAEGRIVVGEGRHSRITHRGAELVEVTLDNGERIRCTPDHRFLLRSGSYKEAQHLTPQDSLMPGYFDAAPVKQGLNKYLRIQQPKTGEYEFVHCLADCSNAQKGLARQTFGAFARHHKNFNRWDNHPANIERMGFLEPLHLHAEHLAELWQDESFRLANRAARQADHVRRLDQNPRYMADVAACAAVALTEKWKSPDYKRQVMRQKVARYGSTLLARFGREGVTPERYAENRTQNWIPRLENALSYYGSFDELLDAAQTYNHKVVSVTWLDETGDVYDITVDEHHNFLLASGVFVHNSIDADPPAAQRYTEARMSPFAMEMLQDLDRDTVDWVENYDQTRREPTVLPSKFPNFLCNGGSGIAVGMATNIPPQNLREVVDGAVHLLDNPNADVDDLLTFVKGPDFPTAGLILGMKGIRQAYSTGRGSVIMQARTTIEPIENGRNQIVVTELPYQVIKSRLIEQIADLVKQKKIEGIADLNDYSDRTGMKIVITLKREAYPKKVLNFLLKHTPLRTTFGVNMLALVDGQPRILTLKDALGYFLDHRREVVTRRTLYELNRAKARAHILEGLQIALDVLDEIIALIRASRTPEVARNEMMARFALSQLQADAILVMQLRALTGLERERLENEYKELLKQIAFYEDILANPARVTSIIKQELKALRDKYGDERRTRIVPMEAEEIGDEDLIPEEEMIVSITRDGYIKRVPKETYPTQHRGGKGRIGAATKDEDAIEHLFVATTHHYILFFTDRGRVYRLKAYEVPQTSRTAMGTAIINLINIQPGERITATVPMKQFKDAEGFLLMATERGEVKRTPLVEFTNLRNNGLIVFDIEENDALRWVAHTSGSDEIFLVTRKGMSIRFSETDITPRSRAAGGVRGIMLSDDNEDCIVGMGVVQPELDLLVIGERGISKRTPLKEYRLQTRGGKGILTMSLSDKTGDIVDAQIVGPEDRLLIMTREGITIHLRVGDIRSLSRNTQGVRAINVADDDRVASVERMMDGKLPAEEVVP